MTTKLAVLKPTDPALKKGLIRWLRENVNDIDQIFIITTWNDPKRKGHILYRSNMNLMEQAWYLEQCKQRIIK